jgi:hypothetical protein
VRYDGTKLDGFLNGVVSASTTLARQAPQNYGSNQYWTIGEGDGTNLGSGGLYFNGQVDEVRIWNVARTDGQITSAWNTTVPANSANLIAYYKMDEGSGTSLTDASGHGNTGTLFNTPAWVNPATAPIEYYAAYLWSPGGATTPTISAASSANYTVTVTDANGCTATSASMTVTLIPLPTFTTSKTDITCFNAGNGSITITVTGGGSFSYSINNGTNYPYSGASPYTINNLIPGNYNIRVKNSNACESLACP